MCEGAFFLCVKCVCRMVDVTARFNAYLQHPQQRRKESVSEWATLLRDSSDPDLDEIEIKRIENRISNLNDLNLKSVGSVIVSVLYENFRLKLMEVQSTDLEKLKREMVVKKYFTSNVSPVLNEQVVERHVSPVREDLEMEAAVMLTTYQSDTDQVMNVRRHLQETSTLLSMLSTRAIEQEEVVGSVLSTAEESIENIEKAEIHLKRAIQNNSSYRFYIVCWFFLLSTILILFDMIL